MALQNQPGIATPKPSSQIWRALQAVAQSVRARNRQIQHPDTNQHHPMGTAGFAVAPRHHMPRTHRPKAVYKQ